MPGLNPEQLPLIRSYLRHLRRFPDQVTRSYLLNLLHKRCRRPHGQDPQRVQARILKTQNFLENVRLKIAAANSGHVAIFEDLLKESFARTGERRETMMKPYLTPVPRDQPSGLSYPSSEFPIYPPILSTLVTSPISNTVRTKPTIADLQFIPPTTVITNTWSDLPAEHQPDLSSLGKAPHMGTLHPARQINHRYRLRKRWTDGLVGPPLLPIRDPGLPKDEDPEVESKRIEAKFGTSIPPAMIVESEAMSNELNYQANIVGRSGRPRYGSPTPNHDSKDCPPKPRRSSGSDERVPSVLSASHPLSPTPLPSIDPLYEYLPKRQRPIQSSSQSVSLKHGPRRLTTRLIRRRYRKLLNLVPVLTTSLEEGSKASVKSRSTGPIDRSWITPQTPSQKRIIVERACPPLGTAGIKEMEGEDLLWIDQ